MNEMKGLVLDGHNNITTCINTYKKSIYNFTSLKSTPRGQDIFGFEKKYFSMGRKDE